MMIVYVAYFIKRVNNCFEEQYAKGDLNVFVDEKSLREFIKEARNLKINSQIGQVAAINFLRIEKHNTKTREVEYISVSDIEEN